MGKHTHKTKDWVTRTPLKNGGELRCSGRVSSSCSTRLHSWLIVVCSFSFGHCVVCSSSIYGFWLPLWYLQTLLIIKRVYVTLDIKEKNEEENQCRFNAWMVYSFKWYIWLFWAYLMKVILSVPDEGYFERTWWRLFQKCIVRTKFDIYVFIVNWIKTW
jgi:hypothetical protein